jgi:hypothetical protein
MPLIRAAGNEIRPKMKLTPRKFAVIAFWLYAGLACAADLDTEGKAWWSHVTVLADDKLEGRNTGSEGYRKAAAYVAQEFRRLGLAGKDFYQPVKFRVRQIAEAQSRLELVANGQPQILNLHDDANFGLPADVADRLDAPLVFAGHGLVIPEHGIDDLAGLDLKGKIAVILSGGPSNLSATVKAHHSHVGVQWNALRQAGAVGMATIRNPKSMDVPWARSTLSRLQPVMSLADRTLDDLTGMKVALRINPERAEQFFAGSGHTFSELLKRADANQPMPKFPLAASIRARVSLRKSQVTSANVVGILEGTDLKSEYVVVSAHLDHLGVGEPINNDRIYNGAMDNAAGVSTLIEVAGYLRAAGRPLRRSILFLAVTGEEKGLLGSKYFAAYPPVARAAIVADVNVDMFLPLYPLKIVRAYGLNESSLGNQLRGVGSSLNLIVQADPEPDRNAFIRSDQYSFVRRGIPSLSLGFGYTPESPEHHLQKEWRRLRYHAPADDLNQPVDKIAAAQFNRLLRALLEHVANDPMRPQWNETSFFRRFSR